MNKKTFLWISSALVALTTTAQADEAEPWAGPYAGFGATMGVSGGQDEFGSYYPFVSTAQSAAEIFAGYNWVSGNLVYGGELSFGPGNLRQQGYPTYGFDDLMDLRARVGYAFGHWMAYAIAVYSRGEYNLDGELYGVDGLGVGVGVAYRATENIFVGAELMHRNLENYDPVTTKKIKKKGTNSLSGEFDTLSLRVGFLF